MPTGEVKEDKPEGFVQKIVHKIQRKKEDKGIKIKGLSDMLIRFGKCCSPLPGEEIIGYITRGRGVTLHLKNCSYVRGADPDRLIEAEWENSEDVNYIARLRITNIAKKGMLTDISAIFSQNEANIIDADVHTTLDKKAISSFTIEVSDYTQLKNIISKIKSIKEVLKVERI